LDRAQDPSAGFDLDFPIGNRAGNMTTGADQQPLDLLDADLSAAIRRLVG
jgi:hypothetical protein